MNKTYGGAWSIYDQVTLDFLGNIKNEKGDPASFCRDYKEWMSDGKNIQGIDKFSNISYSNGTTEAFDKFYQLHMDKRLRLYRGEYFYHQIMSRNFNRFNWVEDDPIRNNDVLVVSVPFSDTGNVPEKFEEILQQCDDNNVPVLLDMAYLNISNIKDLNVNHNCVEVITTSLSKVFPIEHHRIGIRLTREEVNDTLLAYNQNNYVNLYSVNVGHRFIKQFKNDWTYKKYREKQIALCNQLDVAVSDCVIFGIDHNNKFSNYNRGGKTNRLCFSRYFDGRVL
jgi:histidinol-phosphate/aromatic aminotransferase/cobyric acid decarboxylase-like protein